MLDKEKVARIIEKRGIKQVFLADKLNTSKANVNRWVLGKVDAGREIENALATALDVHVSEILLNPDKKQDEAPGITEIGYITLPRLNICPSAGRDSNDAANRHRFDCAVAEDASRLQADRRGPIRGRELNRRAEIEKPPVSQGLLAGITSQTTADLYTQPGSRPAVASLPPSPRSSVEG